MKAFLRTLYDKPNNFMQVVATLLLATGFMFTLVTWMTTDNSLLQMPVALTGVMAILIIVSRVEGAFTVSLSVLIIGTVVASDRFMLAATALIGGESAENVAKIYDPPENRSTPKRSDAGDTEVVGQHLAEKRDPSPETIQLVLEQANIREVAVRVSDLDAERPLTELMAGGRRWQRFVDDFGNHNPFQEDMFILKGLGLADFSESRFAEAYLTNLGKAVHEFLDSQNEEANESIASREEVVSEWRAPLAERELQDENDSIITSINVGAQTGVRFVSHSNEWFKLELPSKSTLRTLTGFKLPISSSSR